MGWMTDAGDKQTEMTMTHGDEQSGEPPWLRQRHRALRGGQAPVEWTLVVWAASQGCTIMVIPAAVAGEQDGHRTAPRPQ